MDRRQNLSLFELQCLDLLISSAQRHGRGLDDVVESIEEQCEGVADAHEAMWEGRIIGLEVSEHDRAVINQMRELAGTLELRPTLGQLIELRGQALRGE